MARWLIHEEEDEAVFRRPMADRLVYGAAAAGVVFMFIDFLLPMFQRGPADQELATPCTVVIGLAYLIFCFSAGPKEIRFDVRRKRYHSKAGFLWFSWTRSGDFREISHLGVWTVTKFKGLSIEWSDPKRLQTTFVSCATNDETWALGKRLGKSLGVAVKAGQMRKFNRIAR